MCKKITSPTFSNINSSVALKDAGAANTSGMTSFVNQLTSGGVYLFKTAGGKFGAFQVNYTNGTSSAKTTWMNIDVKIQK